MSVEQPAKRSEGGASRRSDDILSPEEFTQSLRDAVRHRIETYQSLDTAALIGVIAEFREQTEGMHQQMEQLRAWYMHGTAMLAALQERRAAGEAVDDRIANTQQFLERFAGTLTRLHEQLPAIEKLCVVLEEELRHRPTPQA